MEAELLATLKNAYTTISPDRTTVASFDREGRLSGYFRGEHTYRRALDSRVQVRRREANERTRRWLSQDEARALFAEVYELAADVARRADEPLRQRLKDEVLRWTPEMLLGERDRFHAAYKPITILPPDRYLSIVLQATEGCSWNRCTFCSFYQDRPFRVRDTAAFAEHCRAVKAFLGRGERLRRGIFLADGNALAISLPRLEGLIGEAVRVFPGHALYGFIDLYTGERHPVSDWRRLVQFGLERVYIGMETGHDELLGFLNKPGSRADLLHFVSDLKQAGLRVGIIVMVGVGGQEYRQAHAEATLGAIEAMPLGTGDLVYLSPFVETGGSLYAQRRQERGLTPLSEEAIRSELAAWAERIRMRGMKTGTYDIREFIY